jgi:hypothetical protein
MSTPQQQRRSKADRTYAAFSIRYIVDHPNCEAAVSNRCKGWSSMCHHRRLRSQGGARSLAENVIAVCGPCHDQIHDRVAESRELGLIVGSEHPDYDSLKEPR